MSASNANPFSRLWVGIQLQVNKVIVEVNRDGQKRTVEGKEADLETSTRKALSDLMGHSVKVEFFPEKKNRRGEDISSVKISAGLQTWPGSSACGQAPHGRRKNALRSAVLLMLRESAQGMSV